MFELTFQKRIKESNTIEELEKLLDQLNKEANKWAYYAESHDNSPMNAQNLKLTLNQISVVEQKINVFKAA